MKFNEKVGKSMKSFSGKIKKQGLNLLVGAGDALLKFLDDALFYAGCSEVERFIKKIVKLAGHVFNVSVFRIRNIKLMKPFMAFLCTYCAFSAVSISRFNPFIHSKK